MEITVGGGRVAFVDDEDADLVMQYTWHAFKNGRTIYAHGYKRPIINRRAVKIPMHRLVMGLGAHDGKEVDHRDRDGLNNRKSNLRVTTHVNNMLNRGPNTNRTGRFRGVHLRKESGRWRVLIKKHGVAYHLGTFDTEEEAAMRYNVAAKKLFGEFAYLNPVEMG